MRTKPWNYVLLFGVLSVPSLAWAGVPYPKIFVHGITGTCGDWEPTIETMSNGRPYLGCKTAADASAFPATDSDSFWNIEYYADVGGHYSFAANEEYARRLATFVGGVKAATGAEKVILVGHSMGGLIIRRYMADSREQGDSVHRFVTVATPNLGVYGLLGVGTCEGWIDLMILALPVSDPIRALFDGVTNWEECNQLDDSSGFIWDLWDDWVDLRADTKGDPELDLNQRWGIVGGVASFTSARENDPLQNDEVVEAWSAIPGEWMLAADVFEFPRYRTPNYGFRVLTTANHDSVLECEDTRAAIQWADSYDHAEDPAEPGITIHRHANYNKGHPENDLRNNYPLTFTADQSTLSGILVDTWGDWWDEGTLFNDSVSSVTIDSSTVAHVSLYRDFYWGSELTLTDDVPDLSAYAFNDITSSFQIVLTDSDADGISDYDEYFGEGGDRDGDGLSNGDEEAGGTDPDDADSDEDGTADGDEVALGTDPLDDTDVACVPPAVGDWMIEATCTLPGTRVAPGAVEVASGVSLQISSGARLGLDFSHSALRVGAGAGVQIAEGAAVDGYCVPGMASPFATAETCNGWDDDCDGLVDEEDAEGCDVYYPDEDGDGYGAEALFPDSSGRCLCAPEAPYTAQNQDDCYDQNASAHPGQSHNFATDRGDGSFDYDCSGGTEAHLTAGIDCQDHGFLYGGCTAYGEGWTGGAPGCGGTASYGNDCGCESGHAPWDCHCGPENAFTAIQTCR